MIEKLSEKERSLAEYMSDLSEEAYGAVWMDGLEYALWYVVINGPRDYGRLSITSEHIVILKELSCHVGGWIYFDDDLEETFINIDDWLAKYSKDRQFYESKIN